jgi:peptidyl-prolyl cis-trans isomerase SurA
MQKKIVEVELQSGSFFFKSIPKEDLPFGAEMEVAQIVITPKVSDVEKQK